MEENIYINFFLIGYRMYKIESSIKLEFTKKKKTIYLVTVMNIVVKQLI